MPSIVGRISFQGAIVEAVREAAEFLANEMKLLVSFQCSGEHSPHNEPPYREDGDGIESIGWEETADGANVGVTNMGTGNMIAGNYMAGWDSILGIRGIRRPWLTHPSKGWESYIPEMNKIIMAHMRDALGKA